MTSLATAGWPGVIDLAAPPQRLAAFRVAVGAFAATYLAVRAPQFLALRHRAAAELEPVGVLAWLGSPLPDRLVVALLVLAVAAAVATTTGWHHRVGTPALAACLLVLTTYRSSWGQLLHFENLLVLHALVLAAAPSADAWSLDARRRGRRADREYGWPLATASIITVTSYVVAGIAKVRYGGVDWITGDTLRNHIAYAATRLDVLGGTRSPFARFAVERAWVLRPLALAAVALELGAPLALVGRTPRNVWVACIWAMHIGIAALMFITFPYAVFLVAFAPMFHLEVGVASVAARFGRRGSRLLST